MLFYAKIAQIPENSLVGANICSLVCHGDFSPNFGESILGVRGPKSKIEEQRFIEGSWRTDDQKMVGFHRETNKENQLEVCP